MLLKTGYKVGVCPICGSNNLTDPTTFHNIKGENGVATVPHICKTCGSAVGDVYRKILVGETADEYIYETQYIFTKGVNPIMRG